MKAIILMFVLGLGLGLLGCPQKDETIEDEQEVLQEDDAGDVEEQENSEQDGKHVDDPAEVLEDLIF